MRTTTTSDAAFTRGRQLRAEIDEAADPIGVLVVADGVHTLTPPAPGGYDPDSIPVQAALDDALAGGDAAALARLPDAVVGRVAYQVLAGLCDLRRDRPRSSTVARRTASATSSASGCRDAADRDRRARPVPGNRRWRWRWPSGWAARS